MPEIISVECLDTYDPPVIVILIEGQAPFQVSTGVYGVLKPLLGLPDNPCGGIGS